MIQSTVKPFRRESDNIFEICSILNALIMAVFVSLDPADQTSGAISFIIDALLLFFILTFLVAGSQYFILTDSASGFVNRVAVLSVANDNVGASHNGVLGRQTSPAIVPRLLSGPRRVSMIV
jgi:hypothetical protein